MRPRRVLLQHGSIVAPALLLALLAAVPGPARAGLPDLQRLQWMWSSVPVTRFDPRDHSTVLVSGAVEDHARLQWYNPRPNSRTAAKEHDLKPLLRDAEGGDNNHQVLEWNIWPPAGQDALFSEDWTGITQLISASGADLSESRFIEIWVNDFDADHDSTKALLHLSIGRVSEDAFWSKTAPPNGTLDTEDKNRNGRLDGGVPTSADFEDTGFDGVVSELEPGYDPVTNPDPNGDDYRYSVRDNPDDYSTINNFEFNSSTSPLPDTEDLNRDSFLDTANNYFETTIDLADDRFVEIDVPRDYPGNPNVKGNNGWRLFRIPITGETFRSIGSPSWQNVQHVRLWVSDVARPMLLQIGGIMIDGLVPPAVVDRVALHQNHPNPFNPHTTIPYELETGGRVRLSVYDIQGRLVRTVVAAVESAGPHAATWNGIDRNGRAVATGVYLYEIEVSDKRASRRMVLVR